MKGTKHITEVKESDLTGETSEQILLSLVDTKRFDPQTVASHVCREKREKE